MLKESKAQKEDRNLKALNELNVRRIKARMYRKSYNRMDENKIREMEIRNEL